MKLSKTIKECWAESARKAAFYTLLAFILSFLAAVPLTFSILSVFTNQEKNDFTISDLYAQLADQRPVRSLDGDIVMVDIGRADREGIAEMLEIISLCGPRAVGLDVLFADPQDSVVDARLASALASIPELVMPVGLDIAPDGHFYISEKSFLLDSVPGVAIGATNLTNDFSGGTVREMTLAYPIADGDTVKSMALALAALADPEAAEKAKLRHSEREYIDYPSREFTVIHPDELYDLSDRITGKIVLLGAMGDADDLHATPLDSRRNGLSIHAAALSTILRKAYYTTASRWIPDWLPAIVITFLLLFFRGIVPAGLRGLFTRGVQVVIIILAVRIGYQLFVEKRIIFNFSYTILMVVFAFFGMDIWEGIKYLFMKLRNLLFTLILIAVGALPAMGAFVVHSVSGNVKVSAKGKTTAVVKGTSLSPADVLTIPAGGAVGILNDLTGEIFNSTSTGDITIRQLMLDARKKASDHGSNVASRLNLGSRGSSDKGNHVYTERGMVRRSLAVYDPEASDIVIDPAILADRVVSILNDAAPNNDTSLNVSPAPAGYGFEVTNTLPNPIYLNVIRISPDGASISSIGQPSGTYILLPGQTIARYQQEPFSDRDENALVATYYDFDIDSLLEAVNARLKNPTPSAGEGLILDLPLSVYRLR